MKQWDVAWPATRQEAHFGDRVLICFAERPRDLHGLLVDAVARNPHGEALVCDDNRMQYRDLLETSGRLATGLAFNGVQCGDRVAMLLGNRNEFVVLLFALARLGAVAVPLSIREQTPGLAYMLNHCGAVMVVHEPELADRLPAPVEVPALRLRISMGICDGSQTYSSLLREGFPPEPAAVAEENVAAILYTSGTTGRPKGAMLTHMSIVHSSLHYQIAMGLGPADTAVAAVPLSHVTGLIALITTMVRSAGKLVIMPAFKAAEFVKLATRERMTFTLMVPAMYNLCLLDADVRKVDLSVWRVGAYGGAPMPVSSIEALAETVPGLVLMNCYGATETTSPATLMPQGETMGHNDTVGTPLRCAEIRVMDDSGCEVPAGQLGEIWIKGPMVVKGYWNDPQATAENITGGFWHSGDVGSIDTAGYVRVVDRKKDMINRGGYKIYTIEVENALYSHAAVQECAVVAKPCSVLGERVHAFVSLRRSDVSTDELRAHCKSLLSDYKVPESFTLSTEPLLRNANGKLMKRAMRDQVVSLFKTSPETTA